MVKHRGGTPSAAPRWPLDVPVDTICPKGTIAPSLSVGLQKNVLRRPFLQKPSCSEAVASPYGPPSRSPGRARACALAFLPAEQTTFALQQAPPK
jgi:hypothetical protein